MLTEIGAPVSNDQSACSADAKPTRFELRKQEILDAAVVTFNRHGMREATLAVVAGEIGLNLKSLRYYFERKEDLVCAAFLDSIALHRQLIENAIPIEAFEPRIRHFIRSYCAMWERVYRKQQPEFFHFGDLRAITGTPMAEVVGKAYVDMFRATRRLFRAHEGPWTSNQRSANAHFLLSQLLWSVAAREMPTPFSDSERLSQESFLRAATDLINTLGYRGASVDRISSVLKVTKGAFYHHNDTRDTLIVSCFQRTFDIIRQAQDQAMIEETDGLGHVSAAVASLATRQMRPEGVLLRTSALAAIGPDLRHEMERRLARSTWRFADMLNDGLIDGSVRLCDMRIAAEAVTATINATEELQRWVAEATADNVSDLYLRPQFLGLRPR